MATSADMDARLAVDTVSRHTAADVERSFPVIETIINLACAIGLFTLFAVGVVTLSLSIYTAIRKHNYRQLLVTLILGAAALYYLFDRLHLSSLIREVAGAF